MIEVLFGLLAGGTMGLCVAPIWLVLKIPMKTQDMLNAGTMRQYAVALTLGATFGALAPVLGLPMLLGILAMVFGGLFVGMLTAALVEVIQVVPALFDRLSITTDMRWAAIALVIGKVGGVILAGFLEV